MSNQQTAVEVIGAALDVQGARAAYTQAMIRLERAYTNKMPQSLVDEVTALLDLDEQAAAQGRILQWLEESDGERNKQ